MADRSPAISAPAPATPQPRPTAETLPFWEGCARGSLMFQHCEACGHAQFPPSLQCARCHQPGLTWREATPRGIVHSFTVVHRAPTAAFKERVPYVIALIDLEAGFRMMTNWRGDIDAVVIGLPVHIVFESNGGPWPLPQARPAT